jgi:hypothetical protein
MVLVALMNRRVRATTLGRSVAFLTLSPLSGGVTYRRT